METQDLRDVPKHEERRGGRPAAGTDPQKRRQILDGAGRIFSTLGYDAASMSDVAHEAQVSKATLYVYFQDKEHLFTAICAEKRDRNISELIALLDTGKPIETVLTRIRQRDVDALIAALRRGRASYRHRRRRTYAGNRARVFRGGAEADVTIALAKLIDHHVAAGRLQRTGFLSSRRAVS